MILKKDTYKPIKHGVFEKTEFPKSKKYLHIMPHEESHAVRRKAIL